MSDVKTEEIVVKRQNFDTAMQSIEVFANRVNKNTTLKKVEGNFFGTIKEKELNIFVSQVNDILIDLKNFDLGTLDIITDIFKALEALDKDHITGILIAANSAKMASDKANKNVEAIEKIIKVLQKFKDSLEKMEHLMDVDKAWGILEEHKNTLESLCSYREEISSLQHLMDVDDLWMKGNSQFEKLKAFEEKLKEIHKSLDKDADSIAKLVRALDDLANKQGDFIEEYNKKTSEQQTLIDQNLKENKLEIQKELDSLNKTFSKIQETFNKKFTTLSVEQKQTLDSMQKGQTESLSHIEKVQSEALEELSKSQTSFLNNIERTQSEKLDEIAKEHDVFLSKLSEEQNENLDSINTAIQLEKDALREQANVLDKKMKIAYIVAGSSAAITIIHVILNVLGVI